MATNDSIFATVSLSIPTRAFAEAKSPTSASAFTNTASTATTYELGAAMSAMFWFIAGTAGGDVVSTPPSPTVGIAAGSAATTAKTGITITATAMAGAWAIAATTGAVVKSATIASARLASAGLVSTDLTSSGLV